MEQFAKTLGVSKDATDDEIHRAYRRLASQHHPDLGGDRDQFHKIQFAYEGLLASRQRTASRARTDSVRAKECHAKPTQTGSPIDPQSPDRPGRSKPARSSRPKKGATKDNVPTMTSAGVEPDIRPQHSTRFSPGRPRNKKRADGLVNGFGNRLNFLTRKLPLQDETTTFILINVLDIFMTYVLLRLGAMEANPLANYFFQKFNFNGMIVFKLAIVLSVCLIAQVVALRSLGKAKFLLFVGNVLVGAVVAYSFSLLSVRVL